MSRHAVVTVPAAPALDPLARLAQSRAAMRQVLQATEARPAGFTAQLAAPGRFNGFNAVLEHPVAAALVAAARRGWARHPWNVGLQLAVEMATCVRTSVLIPMVQRHPVKMALAAALLGGVSTGALLSGRAWRWIFKPAVVAGLLSQGLRLAAAAQASSAPQDGRR